MAGATYHPYYRNSWALVIGINSYQHTAPLAYACNDADSVASTLVGELSFPHEQVTVLKDNSATKDAILDAFLGFSGKATDPDDRVLVFFAGHGITVEGLRGPIGYLVPVDGDDKKSMLIRWDDLTRNADLIPAKHILFIMDACYSGLAMQRAVSPGTQRFVSDMLQRLVRQVITAGKADETVADGGGPQGRNSIFTGYLLEGLQGAAADENGVLTATGLMAYVYKKVGQDSRSQQTPHYGRLDGDGDFVFRTPDGKHLTSGLQSDYLVQTVVEIPEVTLPSVVTGAKPTFAISNGYGDPTHPSFGRNDWSSRLGEVRASADMPREVSKAFSWLSVIIEPMANQPVSIDIAREMDKLHKHAPQGPEPFERFMMPRQALTTINSVVLYDEWGYQAKSWDCYGCVSVFGECGTIGAF